MKVISRGTQRITCVQCGSVLEYEWADIKEWNRQYCVICPVCGKSLEVEDKIDNPYSALRGTPLTSTLQEYDRYYPYDVFARDSLCASASASVCALDSATTAISACDGEATVSNSVTAKADVPYTLTSKN